jgi:tight adherence protein B
MSGLILSALPVFLIGVIGMMQPIFYTSKFSDPIFWPTVGAILTLYLLGLVMMHRITNFKY